MWQWIRHPQGVLEDGREMTRAFVQAMLEEELEEIKKEVGEDHYKAGRYEDARSLFAELVFQDKFDEFFTLPGYDCLD